MASKHTNTPTAQDLLKLPRWARVAFAARCARRVQPLFPKLWPGAPKSDVDALNHAITIAATSARQGRTDIDAYSAADTAANIVAIDDDAAAAAAQAAASSAADDDHAHTHAATAAYSAQTAADDADADDLSHAMWYDYVRLLAMATANSWTDESPVDPDILGPLGLHGDTTPPETAALTRAADELRKQLEDLNQRTKSLTENLRTVAETKQRLDEQQALAVQTASAINDKLKEVNDTVAAAIKNELEKGRQAYEQATAKATQAAVRAEEAAMAADKKIEDKIEAAVESSKQANALKLAVEYWESKARGHMWRAIGFGVTLAAAMIIGIWQFSVYVHSTYHAAAQATNAANTPAAPPTGLAAWTLQNLDPGKLIMTAVILTLGIWVLRILARLFLSNLHLQIDSDEKRVMTLSYLSLLAENAFTTKEGEAAMLERLFRSAGTGIVREDGNPTHLIQDIARAFGNK